MGSPHPTAAMSRYRPMDRDDDRLINVADVVTLTSLHRATIYRLIAKDEFPRGRVVVSNRRRWWRSEVIEWILKQPDQRPT